MNVSCLPAPLEWHPAYLDKAWLMEWLNDQSSCYYQVPVPYVKKGGYFMDTPELASPGLRLELTKHTMRDWAPYVGDPFVYMWFTAVDQFGRWIAGESWIHYLPDGFV